MPKELEQLINDWEKHPWIKSSLLTAYTLGLKRAEEVARERGEYNMPSIEVDGHRWIRMVDHIAITERDLKDAREETIKECRHLVYISASLSDAHYRLGEILSSSPDNQPKGGIIACDDDQGLNS